MRHSAAPARHPSPPSFQARPHSARSTSPPKIKKSPRPQALRRPRTSRTPRLGVASKYVATPWVEPPADTKGGPKRSKLPSLSDLRSLGRASFQISSCVERPQSDCTVVAEEPRPAPPARGPVAQCAPNAASEPATDASHAKVDSLTSPDRDRAVRQAPPGPRVLTAGTAMPKNIQELPGRLITIFLANFLNFIVFDGAGMVAGGQVGDSFCGICRTRKRARSSMNRDASGVSC